jgi:predicted nucleic acid-binding protein
MNVLLDTNVLTRIVNNVEPLYSKALQSVMILRSQGHDPCIVPQNLYEFWAVATRPLEQNGLGMTASETRAELNYFAPPLIRLFRDERAILPRWQDLVRAHDVLGKATHDARLVAAMLRHGIFYILTFDVSLSRFDEVTVLTPDAVLSGTRQP